MSTSVAESVLSAVLKKNKKFNIRLRWTISPLLHVINAMAWKINRNLYKIETAEMDKQTMFYWWKMIKKNQECSVATYSFKRFAAQNNSKQPLMFTHETTQRALDTCLQKIYVYVIICIYKNWFLCNINSWEIWK